MTTYIEDMAEGYVTAAVWTTLDNDGEPINPGTHIGPGEWSAVRDLCAQFLADNRELLTTDPWSDSPARAGHDLWLTRNGHGAGFWDRGAGAVGQSLTDSAHAWGPSDAYLGDDGMLYGLAD